MTPPELCDTARPPNILFILTDQQRFDSLGANGNALCRTPATDRLGREGINFTHAFTPSALCTPARASLLTGLYPHNHGMIDLTNARRRTIQELPEGRKTYAEELRAEGYRLAYVGKWHTGADRSPLDWGFDRYLPGEGWHQWLPPGVTLEAESAVRLGYDPGKPMAARVPRPLDEYPEIGRTDAALGLLEEYARGEAPFCLQLNYFGPHYPHYLPEPYHSLFDPASISPWDNFRARPRQPHYGYRWLRRRWSAPSDDWSHYAQVLAAYYGQIALIEDQISRVLDALDRLELAADTLVFFAADHGEMGGGHGLLQKGAVAYDELYRVPLLARWPGRIAPGTACNALVNLCDLVPTFLHVGGGRPDGDLDGRSLLPLLRGAVPDDWPDEVFAEYLASQQGDMPLKILRTRRHKLAVNPAETCELFDLEADPGETANRIDAPDCAAARSAMARRLMAHMRRSGDPEADSYRSLLEPLAA